MGTLRFWLGAPVTSLAFAPDGKTVAAAAAGHSRVLRVWEVPSGRLVRVLPAFADELPAPSGVRSVSFAPDGATVAAGCDDGTIRMWATASGHAVAVLRGHAGYVDCVDFSPDGNALASGGADGTARLWNAHTGRQIRQLTLSDDLVSSIAFSRDGTKLAAGCSDGLVRLMDTESGNEIRRFSCPGTVRSIAFAPNHTVVLCPAQSVLQIHGRGERQQVGRINLEPGLVALRAAFSPDGMVIALATGNSDLRLLDAKSGEQLRRVILDQPANAVAFSPDGKLLVSGGGVTVQLWEVSTGAEASPNKRHNGPIHKIAFSPNGRTLASTSSDGTLRLWGVANGRQIRATSIGRRGHVGPLSFGRDGKTVSWATADFEGRQPASRCWDARGGQVARQVALRGPGLVRPLAFWPGKDLIVAQIGHGDLGFWDATTGDQIRRLRTSDQGVTRAVVIASDGTRLASGGDSGTVEIWDAATLAPRSRFRASADSIQSVSFSPKGEYVCTAGMDGIMRIWVADTSREYQRSAAPKSDGESAVRAVAWSPDGRCLVFGGDDNHVHVWDVQVGREIRQLHGHEKGITDLVYSLDGRLLVSGSADGTALVWDQTEIAKRDAPR